MKVFIAPQYRGPDNADGGIRRVVEAQNKYLPEFGIEVTTNLAQADLVASHALEGINIPTNIPWVLHCHGLYYQEFGWQANWYKIANERLSGLLKSADYITAPSEWIAQTLRRVMWNNPKVLMHGVDPEEWSGGENNGYILWNKAREDAASNPESLNVLAQKMPNHKFVTTFGKPQSNVIVTDAMPYEQGKEYIKNAGLYLSTTQETFGIGTLEAMAAGVPIAGWDFGGNSEIIEHKTTGYLARPGDYDDLILGIEWLMANREQISKNCLIDINNRWTWKEAIQRYAEYYTQIYEEFNASRPKVSVIIPCYNLGKYLPEAIDSVLQQTESDCELIIVDDASTDNTESIVKEYMGVRPLSGGSTKWPIKYFKNEKNMHVSYTRNRGIRASNGKYILCLDADDKLNPTCLEVLSNALDSDRRVHLAYGGLQIMNEAGETRQAQHEWPVPFDLNMQLDNKNCVPTVCMFRRSAFDRTGGYRMGINPVEDGDLWTRMAFTGNTPMKVTEGTTFFYRLRGDSISRTMPHPRWDSWYNKNNITFLVADGKQPKTYLPAKISVIIPVGPDHENICLNAIDSVYLQSFENWECIVINDTGKELPFVPSWCKLINTPGKVGPGAARNLGIQASTTTLFLPLDADDYLQPDALEVLFENYLKYNGVIYSQWYDQNETATVYDPPEYNPKLLVSKGCIHAITALYPKDAWQLVGGFDPQLTHWEDWDFQLALADKGICATKIPIPLWTYRKLTGKRREQNVSNFNAGKEAILSKWSKLWNGEDLMACGGCSRGGAVYSAPVQRAANNPSSPSLPVASSSSADMLLLEFTGNGGARNYRGSKTGTIYRFGSDPDHRVRLVDKADAQDLLNIAGAFRIYDRDKQPQLA